MNYYLGHREDAEKNNDFRSVVFTSTHIQVVLMTVPSGEEIGEEVHEEHDQTFVIVAGEAKVIIGAEKLPAHQGDIIVIPVGVYHNIKSLGPEALKLYSFCTPPHHQPGTVHTTRQSATREQEH